jgi:succinate dehydrogenase / fumarate reductase flavoprotein subunit
MAGKINYDKSVLPYFNYSVQAILVLAKATLICAKERRESRGAHYRSDYPETIEDMRAATIISYDDGAFNIRLDREGRYEN